MFGVQYSLWCLFEIGMLGRIRKTWLKTFGCKCRATQRNPAGFSTSQLHFLKGGCCITFLSFQMRKSHQSSQCYWVSESVINHCSESVTNITSRASYYANYVRLEMITPFGESSKFCDCGLPLGLPSMHYGEGKKRGQK